MNWERLWLLTTLSLRSPSRLRSSSAQAREVVEIEGASHAVGVSHPEEVADVILRAIKAVE